jgi:di/tricarboxylate transporter
VSPSIICFIILGAGVALFVWNRLPIGIVAIAAMLSLYFTGVQTLNQALAGFGDPVVMFIASLRRTAMRWMRRGSRPGRVNS